MKSRLIILALAALCLCAVAGAKEPDARGSSNKTQLIVPMRSGAFVSIRTESVPPGAGGETSDFAESEDNPNVLQRVFVDNKNDLFFGYELMVERVAPAGKFRVTVRPLGEAYMRQLRARPMFQKRRIHPSYNAAAFNSTPQLINDGDTFALDVLQSARTGTKIIDVITVTLADPGTREALSDSPPRDLALEEVQLKVTNYRLAVNGETIRERPSGGCTGALVWFALPDRGRFIISLVPRPGFDFHKVGSIKHNALTFEWDGDRYEWESSQPIVGTGGNWNVWVLHDPDYKFDIFDQPTMRAAESETLTKQYEEAKQRARQRQTKAELGAPSAQSSTTATAPNPRRVRVVIGSADAVEYLFPKQ